VIILDKNLIFIKLGYALKQRYPNTEPSEYRFTKQTDKVIFAPATGRFGFKEILGDIVPTAEVKRETVELQPLFFGRDYLVHCGMSSTGVLYINDPLGQLEEDISCTHPNTPNTKGVHSCPDCGELINVKTIDDPAEIIHDINEISDLSKIICKAENYGKIKSIELGIENYFELKKYLNAPECTNNIKVMGYPVNEVKLNRWFDVVFYEKNN
jgi:hypothetical protein